MKIVKLIFSNYRRIQDLSENTLKFDDAVANSMNVE